MINNSCDVDVIANVLSLVYNSYTHYLLVGSQPLGWYYRKGNKLSVYSIWSRCQESSDSFIGSWSWRRLAGVGPRFFCRFIKLTHLLRPTETTSIAKSLRAIRSLRVEVEVNVKALYLWSSTFRHSGESVRPHFRHTYCSIPWAFLSFETEGTSTSLKSFEKSKANLLFSGTIFRIVRVRYESFSITVRTNQTAVVTSCRSILKCIIKETRILSTANVRGTSTRQRGVLTVARKTWHTWSSKLAMPVLQTWSVSLPVFWEQKDVVVISRFPSASPGRC